MTLESALLPVPSEVTMPFAGSLVSTGVFNFWLLVAVGALANLVGSLLAYGLGYWGEEYIAKLKFIRQKDFEAARKLFIRFGDPIVFAGRVLPVIRTYISLPAGIARMEIKKFITYTVVGSLVWSAVLTYAGVVLGNNWRRITPFFHIIDVLVVAMVIIGVAWFVVRRTSLLKR